jgi:Proline-rich nuclear receptor coactivator motif
MSTPQYQNTQGPRRSSRRSKNTNAGLSEGDQPVSDSGPSTPDTGYIAATPSAQSQLDTQNRRRKSQGPKRTHNTPKPDRAPNQRHASPQPNPAHQSQRPGTPIKQAYAGPTFHSSPAPSALPLPSFYSKSMPSIPSAETPDTVEGSEAHKMTGGPLGCGTQACIDNERKRESTPLDFLFEAARQARDTPRAESPASRSANLSAVEDSPVSRSPAPREGGETVFPFELDGNGSHVNSIGPAFATPYKERMAALRSSSASPSIATPDLDEDDRRTKTEALKKLLMTNAQAASQHQASTLPYVSDPNNPFNSRAPELRGSQTTMHQTRQRSGPSTPIPTSNASGQHQYYPGLTATAYEARATGSPMYRPPSSHLRRQYQVQDHDSPAELSSDNSAAPPPISTARKTIKQPQSPYQSSNNSNTALPRTSQTPNHKSSHSAQQLEDDLRRVLKLDLTSRG